MADENFSLSPTLVKVLDEYRDTLLKNNQIDGDAVGRLDQLLRRGKVPKFEEIDKAVFSSAKEANS